MRWSDLSAQEDASDAPLLFSLHRETADPDIVARFTVTGEPGCKARARNSGRGGRHYSPASNQVAEEGVGWAFRRAGGGRGGPDGESSFGVYAVFFCRTGRRRDVDNMMKLLLDALNGIAWVDDTQVEEISAKLLRRSAEPRTVVVIYTITTTSHPGSPGPGISARRECA